MFAFASAIVVASLLGSLHCVGMCGPLALWAVDRRRPRLALVSYHLGRLTTYLSAGLMAGLIGSALTMTGDIAGIQSIAAKAAGVTLIVVGSVRLIRMTPWASRRLVTGMSGTTLKPSLVAGWLQNAKPLLASRGAAGRGFLAGLLTTWLPCGWLYLFVLTAAGTGHVVSAIVVMSAFWVGTLPALTGLVLGARSLLRGSQAWVPAAAAVLLILTGAYTATGRAAADLTGMTAPIVLQADGATPSAAGLDEAIKQPLPCCVAAESKEL